MASSNRHWPSMFKSKPCNSQHQWQHDLNPSLMSSSGCHRTSPYSSGCEERTPEPKPRWNPKPEQIRILEAIFDSGLVNPPRDEIRKIRAQLQEYGPVGDANVFYWFQNRKSRSKHKLRHLQTSKQQQKASANQTTTNSITTSSSPTTITAPSSSSSSSSDKNSPTVSSKQTALSLGPSPHNALDLPIGSMHQALNFPTHHHYHHGDHFFADSSSLFPQQGGVTSGFTQGLCFSSLPSVAQVPDQLQHTTIGPCTSLLLSEIMNTHHGGAAAGNSPEKLGQNEKVIKTMQLQPPHHQFSTYSMSNPLGTTTHCALPTIVSTLPSANNSNHLQGVGDQPQAGGGGEVGGGGEQEQKSTVFINDVAFQVAAGPFNVREAFGDGVVLINSCGQLVLTNEWGVTLQSLQHGASYYLI